jgi:heme-degrading monooxygenase HmoA
VGGTVIAVIFEVVPNAARREDYLDAAAQLHAPLEAVDGFLSIERFASLSQPGKILSLSFWRDEAAVCAWRETALHRAFQAQGRAGIFDDYRLRVAAVVRDYGLHERAEAPGDSRRAHG